jgi:DNA-directed RNA polymerase subunit RPC12/RpoP
MSEFKFACPVCGQHITADDSTSGGQIDCPTCFQKIVVPQAPASQDTKFILSAAQVAKPRPTVSQPGPLPTSSPRTSTSVVVVLVVLLCAAGTALYVFRDRVFKPSRGPGAASTNTLARPSEAPAVLNTTYPVPTNIVWTLDLAKAVIPEETAAGRIHGSGFFCQRSTVEGGTVALRQGKTWPPDLGITLLLNLRPGEELSGKTIEIAPSFPRPPRIVVRWKDAQQEPAMETIRSGYALKLAFGQPAQGRLPGKIYVGLPDEARSFIAGTFEAEIREPRPPKAKRRSSPRPKG